MGWRIVPGCLGEVTELLQSQGLLLDVYLLVFSLFSTDNLANRRRNRDIYLVDIVAFLPGFPFRRWYNLWATGMSLLGSILLG